MTRLVYKWPSGIVLKIKVKDGHQFHLTLKALSMPCGKEPTATKIFDDLISGKRKSAYGWTLV